MNSIWLLLLFTGLSFAISLIPALIDKLGQADRADPKDFSG